MNAYVASEKPTMKKSSCMQLAKPAKLQSNCKKKGQVMCDEKNCQSTNCVPMQSVTKPNLMWSVGQECYNPITRNIVIRVSSETRVQ